MGESLEQSIRRQLESVSQRFCMPGHKGKLNPLDVTEAGDMDNLMHPQGALQEAHERCATAYGAQAAHFCVNGSTSGVIAMLCSLPLEGKTVLLCADCHYSAVSGLIHSGANVQMLPPNCREDGLSLPASADDVSAALQDNPSIAAVFITSPNYYGFLADIPAIATLCHQKGIPLLVDAAHGAHFGFASCLPPQPVEADAWVVSAHKTLSVSNQGAILLFGKNSGLEERRVWDALSTVQTSSPSWPLLCALDNACTDLCQNGQVRYSELIGRIRRFEDSLSGLPVNLVQAPSIQKDPTRLVLSIRDKGITGFEAAASLQSQGIWVEMADICNLVLIITPMDTDEDFESLYTALSKIPNGNRFPINIAQPKHGTPEVSPRCAAYGTMAICGLKDACGRIAARAICCYPPGVAIVLPGQRITQEQIDYLLAMQDAGAQLVHAENSNVYVLP